MVELDSAALWSITLRTVGVCPASLSIALVLGVPIGIWLGGRLFLGRRLLLGLVNSGMGAPPVVVGLLVAQLFYRSGPLGHLGQWDAYALAASFNLSADLDGLRPLAG